MKKVNNIKKVMNEYKDLIADASKEVSITELANIQSNTPVKTGNLKKSIGTEVRGEGSDTTIVWGSDLAYAPKVEFENTSYLRQTLRDNHDEIVEILKKHLEKIDS
ncbi:HK97 gp10 family phage protein [Clostridium sp.]|uniref:HK97 gp10 family phage protein n=1 Tax=Clostridium sp. TaxID=1506 RepID=UPI001D273776|nr:HK97 gp10 family phage protein [Clostridium sp.]MBS5937758.1 HK97 gp10 family phage protein [Clostridium sp.]